MKTLYITSFIMLSMMMVAFGQDMGTDLLAKKELQKLNFLVGNWEGKGWVYGQDQNKHVFDQTELIQYKLDSTAILIEGLGTTNGEITHNALAVITYNKDDKSYYFDSYLSSGLRGKFKAELIQEKLFWYPNNDLRYIIYLNEDGNWYEKGEIKRGNDWFQFFEMTLSKKK